MAISETQQTQIVDLTVGMFRAAPGATFLHEFESFIDAGGSVRNLADVLAGTQVFSNSEFYPAYLTPTEFAWKFLGMPPCPWTGGFVSSGLFSGGVIAGSDLTWAANWIVGKLKAGESIGQVCYDAIMALDAVGDPVNGYGNSAFASVAHAFDNRVAVAKYFSVEYLGPSTDVSTLQGVIQGVTADPKTVDEAIDRLTQIRFEIIGYLSTGSDVLFGSPDNDLFVGVVSVAGAATTLQNLTDLIDGGAGRDTLQVVVRGQEAPDILPNAKNVEVLKVMDVLGSTWDLSLMPQLDTITSEGSAAGTTFAGLDHVVPNISIVYPLNTSDAALIIKTGPGVAPGAVTLNLKDSGSYAAGEWQVSEKDINGHGLMTSVTVHATGFNTSFVLDGTEKLASAELSGGADGAMGFRLTDYGSFTFLNALHYVGPLTAIIGDHPYPVTILLSGGHQNEITLGEGRDTVVITGLPGGASTYDSVANFSAGDTLDLLAFNLGGSTFTETELTLAPSADFWQYLDAMTECDGSANSRLGWFEWNGDTYLVEDRSAASTFQEGTDFVIRLVGLVDLSHATGTGAGGTYGGDGILIGG